MGVRSPGVVFIGPVGGDQRVVPLRLTVHVMPRERTPRGKAVGSFNESPRQVRRLRCRVPLQYRTIAHTEVHVCRVRHPSARCARHQRSAPIVQELSHGRCAAVESWCQPVAAGVPTRQLASDRFGWGGSAHPQVRLPDKLMSALLVGLFMQGHSLTRPGRARHRGPSRSRGTALRAARRSHSGREFGADNTEAAWRWAFNGAR